MGKFNNDRHTKSDYRKGGGDKRGGRGDRRGGRGGGDRGDRSENMGRRHDFKDSNDRGPAER